MATTKGIREIDLRQVEAYLAEENEEEMEESENTSASQTTSTDPGNTRKTKSDASSHAKITSKSISSLPSFRNKSNILKMAISQFVCGSLSLFLSSLGLWISCEKFHLTIFFQTPSSKDLDHNIIVQWVESHPYFPYCTY